jgi:hypothetical protein
VKARQPKLRTGFRPASPALRDASAPAATAPAAGSALPLSDAALLDLDGQITALSDEVAALELAISEDDKKELWERLSDVMGECSDLLEEAAELRATTPRGMQIKAKAIPTIWFREEIVKRYDDAADIHLVTSLLRDLGAEVPSEAAE